MEVFNVSEMEHRLNELVMTNDAYPPDLVTRARRICEDVAFIEFKIEHLRRLLNHEEID